MFAALAIYSSKSQFPYLISRFKPWLKDIALVTSLIIWMLKLSTTLFTLVNVYVMWRDVLIENRDRIMSITMMTLKTRDQTYYLSQSLFRGNKMSIEFNWIKLNLYLRFISSSLDSFQMLVKYLVMWCKVKHNKFYEIWIREFRMNLVTGNATLVKPTPALR